MALTSRLLSRATIGTMLGLLIVSLVSVSIFTKFGILSINRALENFLVEKKDITEGGVNEFYVGMSRLSVIEALGNSAPSSVEAIPSITFDISDINSEDWKKLDINADIGIMQTSGNEIVVKLHEGKVETFKCIGLSTELCNTIHIGISLNAIEIEIKAEMKRGNKLHVFPVLFYKPTYLPVAALQNDGYKSLSGYNGWKIRYNSKDKGDKIYDLFFINEAVSRIRYEYASSLIGE